MSNYHKPLSRFLTLWCTRKADRSAAALMVLMLMPPLWMICTTEFIWLLQKHVSRDLILKLLYIIPSISSCRLELFFFGVNKAKLLCKSHITPGMKMVNDFCNYCWNCPYAVFWLSIMVMAANMVLYVIKVFTFPTSVSTCITL